ncbi:glycosyltransferase family 87 protein [Arthrobacter sp. RAF14]|uniref:glycosyltransferase family 87 protein n=1 Tax=Arthrobacter sp. RAF14 TaxID=3233051 RepID=UPI003F8EE4FE
MAGHGAPRTRTRLVVPTRADSLLSRFTELVGGPLGRRTAPGVVSPGFFTVDRVLVLLTVVAALVALAIKSFCRVQGWGGAGAYYGTCYSDFPTLLGGPAFTGGSLPVFTPDVRFEYPVLLGVVAALTALAVPGSGGDAQRALGYFDLNSFLVVALWIGTVLVTARLAHRRKWDAAMVALAPGIITAGFINWDLWAVFALSLALLCFARRRPVWAGVWIGVGASFKFYPLLLLIAVLILAIRSGTIRTFGRTVLGCCAALLAVNVPFALFNPGAFRYFFDFAFSRGAGFSSLWESWNLVAARLGQPALSATQVNVAAVLCFAVAVLLIAALALAVPRRPRLAQVLFLLVAAFILCNKVYSPQFVLWLIPLAALARPVWRDFLLWQAAEVLHWAAIWMYLGAGASGSGPQHNIDVPYYVCAVLLHMGATFYLMVRVAWDMMHPDDDAVQAGGVDDPQGGVFDRSPDRLRLQPRRPRTVPPALADPGPLNTASPNSDTPNSETPKEEAEAQP